MSERITKRQHCERCGSVLVDGSSLALYRARWSCDRCRLSDAERFYFDHAGWSHAPDESSLTGRLRTARELARAARIASDRGWTFTTEHDSDDCADGAAAEDINAGRLVRLVVTLWNADGEPLSSVGSVIVTSEHDDYLRVVRAELACEAL